VKKSIKYQKQKWKVKVIDANTLSILGVRWWCLFVKLKEKECLSR
jgi:hypothetical protein